LLENGFEIHLSKGEGNLGTKLHKQGLVHVICEPDSKADIDKQQEYLKCFVNSFLGVFVGICTIHDISEEKHGGWQTKTSQDGTTPSDVSLGFLSSCGNGNHLTDWDSRSII